MQITEYLCDLCGKKVKPDEYDHFTHLREISLSVFCYQRNPFGDIGCGYQEGEFKAKEVCESCRRFIAQRIVDAIKKCKPQ